VDSYRPQENTKYLFDALMNPPGAHTRVSKDAIQYEAEELLIAGSDTTATTLTYACVNLSQQPDLWEKIYQEVLPLYKDRNTIVRSKDIETLPFLTACIKESQ
jgi:cytochrome P450